MAALPRYEMEYHITSIVKGDDDATFTVRRNGKFFYIEISPSNFVNSPAMAKKYRSYLEVLKSGEEVLDQVYDTDVYEWVMAPFEHFLIELAPDPSVESVENIAVTLKEYLYPEFFAFILDIIDENLQPRHVPTERSPHCHRLFDLMTILLDDVETWTAFYDPAGITTCHKNPEDALFKPPKKGYD